LDLISVTAAVESYLNQWPPIAVAESYLNRWPPTAAESYLNRWPPLLSSSWEIPKPMASVYFYFCTWWCTYL